MQRMLTSALVKIKILTAHQQVLQGLAGVFRLTWPPAFKELLSYLSVFNFDFITRSDDSPSTFPSAGARTSPLTLPPPM